MENGDSSQSAPEEEQRLAEENVNNLLKTAQDSVRNKGTQERSSAIGAFLSSLYALPSQFRSLKLRIRLDARDERIERYKKNLGNLGLTPLNEEGMVYDLQVLTPRMPTMKGITAPHGSSVRERVLSVGSIETIKVADGYDPETKDDNVLLVNPTSLGFFSLDQMFGKYWLFPRQIEDIKLSTDLPPYLDPSQTEFVDQFYDAVKLIEEASATADARLAVDPPLPDTSTAAAVHVALEDPLETLAKTSKAKLLKRGASEWFMANLENMEGSKTGLGLRRQDGTLFEVAGFLWDRIQFQRTVVAEGSSLPSPIKLIIDFSVPPGNFTDENILCAEKDACGYARYMCYTALGSNTNLEGRLVMDSSDYLSYKWRDKEEVGVLVDDVNYKIFFSYDPETTCSRDVKITKKFDPATVTPQELDRAIARLRSVPLLTAEEPPLPKLAEMPKTYELITNPVDEIASNPLDKPKFVKAVNGTITYGTDEGIGYKDKNEDAVVVNTGKGNGFAVIDGMGGEGRGDEAAQILAEEFQKGLNEGSSFEDIQKSAHERMEVARLGCGGACYIGLKIDGKKLNVAQAGDVKLIVLDKSGIIKFGTTDEVLAYMISNAVQGIGQGKTTIRTTDLSVGDRIVVASDGLFKNLSPQGVSELIYGRTIQEAIFLLNMYAKDKMQNFKIYREQGIQANPDNISILIYDIESLDADVF